MSYYYGFKPYVSVAKRRAQALKKMDMLRKKGVDIQPVEIEGRKIAKTFWGQAWCDHMESNGDFANRLPRGRTYVRNGSVCHLSIAKGSIEAIVSGSELYHISLKIDLLAKKKWNQVKQSCRGQIGSLLELLGGRISDSVMEVVTDQSNGLFPASEEIKLNCNCPDYAYMCKHVAAVLYGVGSRLDRRPEMLFELRGVDHTDLITADADEAVSRVTKRGSRRQLASGDLGDVFGIELDSDADEPPPANAKRKRKTSTAKRKRVAKKKQARRKPKSADPSANSATSETPKKRKAAKKRVIKKKRVVKAKTRASTSAQASGTKKVAKKRAAKKKTSKARKRKTTTTKSAKPRKPR